MSFRDRMVEWFGLATRRSNGLYTAYILLLYMYWMFGKGMLTRRAPPSGVHAPRSRVATFTIARYGCRSPVIAFALVLVSVMLLVSCGKSECL